MSGSIWGTGRKRRDDVLNRVMDTIYRGQPIPLGGNYDPVSAQTLAQASSLANTSVTVLDLVTQDGSRLIICGLSEAGGPDICG